MKIDHRTDNPSDRTERRRKQVAEERSPMPSCVRCGVSISGIAGTRFCRWCHDNDDNKEQ